ncbi:MAG TPA: sucrase ferredoxin [Actinomycetota bacterium]|nr:sucrase ferredoxin [Actinomycetota bacterium]
MTAEPFRCSSFSLELGEPMFGTASTATQWILVEQPGPWGWDAVVQSRLSRRVAGAFRSMVRDLAIRVVLIRRPGRRPAPQGRQCYLIHSGPDTPWIEHAALSRLDDLLEADLSELSAGRPTGLGSVGHDPVFLVCTNGARDPCCAERGRPLAASLEREYGDRVWECSHIGGDRFAPNLVCLPHGLYFGRVAPKDGPRIAQQAVSGVLDLDHYRGRSCYPFEVQAAEYFARRQWRLTHIDDLRPIRRTEIRRGEIEVEFERKAETRFLVRLRIARAEPPRLLTCKSTSVSRPPRYVVPDGPAVGDRF